MNADPLITIGIFFVFLFLAAIASGLLIQRRRGVRDATTSSAPDWVKSSSTPPTASEERVASPISESIEELVRARMLADPSLQARKLDFGSTAVGTLEIWVDNERYLAVDDIPDERIRSIIQQAVDAYNEGGS